jgi:hypothetical protein
MKTSHQLGRIQGVRPEAAGPHNHGPPRQIAGPCILGIAGAVRFTPVQRRLMTALPAPNPEAIRLGDMRPELAQISNRCAWYARNLIQAGVGLHWKFLFSNNCV